MSGTGTGSRSGVALFAAMLITAGLLFPLAGWLVASGTTPHRDDQTEALMRFLEHGPSAGLWEAERRSDRRRAYFARLRGDPDRVLMAPAPTDQADAFCRTCKHPCSYTAAQVMRFFFEAPSALFAKNYVQEGGVEIGRLRSGEEALVARFVPRRHVRGDNEPMLTGREVWFDKATGEVLQIEDQARSGHPIRIVWRVSPDTGAWDPDTFDPVADPVCVAPCPSCRVPPAQQLEIVQADAPFKVVRPTSLPAGFELIRARYREVPVRLVQSAGEDEDEVDVVPARFASLLYSDGLGLLSIAMAPSADMDALEGLFARSMSEEDGPQGGSTSCPTTPPAEVARVARASGDVVRWRQDVCRTVARRDGVSGLSVTLLGRNELSGDEYLEILLSIAPLDP